MYNDFNLVPGRPVAIQVKEYLVQMITKGIMQTDRKLPTSRELCKLLHVGRNTVLSAYTELEEEGFIYAVKGKGYFVSTNSSAMAASWQLDWKQQVNEYAELADQIDVMKRGLRWEKGMISFTSVAPDEKLFDLHNVKRAFLDRMSLEGDQILNYGYANGYKPLIDYIKHYMATKGADLSGKDILITNGFTEGLELLLSTLIRPGSRILCENPTHLSALKLFKLHGCEVTGVGMEQDGIDLDQLEKRLAEQRYDLAYMIPSYHNPTGIVMSADKRIKALNLFAHYQTPVIEDGFNEELRYSGSHVSPLIACSGGGNGVIYIGSFSKILFPGMRVGWIFADQELIQYLVSIKRARSIHTSTLDQAVLFQYMHNGNFEKYMKKAKSFYKKKYELAMALCKQYIPYKRITGDGGLHLFIEADERICARKVLQICYAKGVLFTPGDVFYTDGQGSNTMRLGFSRLSDNDMETGMRVIGETIKTMLEG